MPEKAELLFFTSRYPAVWKEQKGEDLTDDERRSKKTAEALVEKMTLEEKCSQLRYDAACCQKTWNTGV